ncbi:MAG: amino acid ABC transporter permease [Hyphomicrobiales bacterium]|nr:amino acid ABC transporter permease [Hyphomicrobiales bacterium]OQW82406.1 MAG: glutamate ABC transporter permease [Proteobacteria bacterium ST_bin15]
MNYHWNWGIFLEPSPEGIGTYFDMLMMGLRWTLVTAVLAWIIAISLGGAVGVLRTLPSRLGVGLGDAYVEFFRNIPLLVQLFLWYFVLPELLPKDLGNWLKTLPNASFWTGAVGVGLFMSARIAEQVKAGIQSLPQGQSMAATALGLTTAQTYIYVLLPMTLRVILPPLTSETLNTLKNTSVALTIGLAELTARTRAMQEYSFQVFEAFTAATVIYLVVNAFITVVLRRFEKAIAIPGYVAGT